MAKQTILVNASYAPSLTNFRGPLLSAMVAAGHEVHASSPGLNGALAEKLQEIGVTPHDIPLDRAGFNPLSDIAYFRAMSRLVRDVSPGIVLGYTIKPCIWGSLAARVNKVQSHSLITGLGYAFISGNGLRQKIVGAISRTLWRISTVANTTVIFQNPDDQRDFIAAGALADPVKARLVSGSGVDMAHYARADLPPSPVFLMIARLLGNKGVREYGQAATMLIKQGVAAEFRLAGFFDEGPDGISQAELREWQDAGLVYLGLLDDVRPAIAEASVYVLPSYREGTPRSVLEAMSMGRPVITSDAPGCRETVIPGQTGLLVPARDPQATADAMSALAQDRTLRTRMGEAGYDLCLRKYAVERVNQTMFEHLGLSDG